MVIAATPSCLRLNSRRGPRLRSCCPACRPVAPGVLAGVVLRTIRLAGSSWWPLALAAAGRVSYARPCWRQRRVPSTRRTGAARSGGAASCAMACAASAALRGGVRRRGSRQPRAPRAPGPQRGSRAVRWSCRAWWGHAPSSPGPGTASATISHGPWGGAASGGQGGSRVGGGGRAPGGQGTCLSPQQPNKGLQATPSSLRSCLAPASGRA